MELFENAANDAGLLDIIFPGIVTLSAFFRPKARNSKSLLIYKALL